jgi:hypothetical protein
MACHFLGLVQALYQKVTGLKKREILLFRVHDSFRE